MKKRINYQYDKIGDTLEVTIDIRQGFFNTIGYLFFTIALPIGLIFAIISFLGILRVVSLSANYIILFSFLAIVNICTGAISLYQFLNYNFGREMIILNNRKKYLEYKHILFRFAKTKEVNYSDFSKIILDQSMGRGGTDYFIALQCGKKKVRIGIVNNYMEGQDIVKILNDFIK